MMFDAGWSDNDDNTKLNPDIDVPGLIAYARSKNVGVILWNEALALDRNLEAALDRYAAWGARGIMCDFMERDDQKMVRFYERVARAAAKRHLIVNLHGAFKPTGLQRAFPNLLSREGVLGHEWNMWSERVTPDHALTVPFVRMAAGPMDWEGGSMQNGTKKTFRVVFDQPMNQGTRTQQLAQYVLYESPLQYLAGTPVGLPRRSRLHARAGGHSDDVGRDSGHRRRGRGFPRRGPSLRQRLVSRRHDRLDGTHARRAAHVPAAPARMPRRSCQMG